MLRFTRWLLPAWLLASVVTAAPVPETSGASAGPISDYLRLRALLTEMSAPHPTKVVARGDRLEVTVVVSIYVDEARMQKVPVTEIVVVEKEVVRTVVRGGKEVQEKAVVRENVPRTVEVMQQYVVKVTKFQTQTMQVTAKECRYYTVTRGGKLEELDAAQAKKQLAEPSAVLLGTSATVDPRHLETVKPGTVYVLLPERRAVGIPLPPPEGGLLPPIPPPDR